MALLFALLLGLAAILLGTFLHEFSKENFIRETEAVIDVEMQAVLALTNGDDVEGVIQYIKNRKDSSTLYHFHDENVNVLASDIGDIPYEVETIREGVLTFFVEVEGKGLSKVAAKIFTLQNNYTLMIARDIEHIHNTYQRFKQFSVMIIVFMLLVVLISFFLSTFVVTRINKITNIAKEIMYTGDLSRRITVDSHWDDLSYLALTLNDLLAKIESLMQGIRDVSDNIAHDLRTPLTRLRGHLESFHRKQLTGNDIKTLLNEADAILNTFNSLLRIANIEKGKRIQAFESQKLAPILEDVVELYEPLAEVKNITIISTIDDSIALIGDRDLLFQMFANVIDNAIKFSSQNGIVTLIAEKHKKKAFTITIADDGVGISDKEKEKVFHRFYRSDKSRFTEGSGLGLSMVKAVAELHGAAISLHDNNPGLRIEFRFK